MKTSEIKVGGAYRIGIDAQTTVDEMYYQYKSMSKCPVSKADFVGDLLKDGIAARRASNKKFIKTPRSAKIGVEIL